VLTGDLNLDVTRRHDSGYRCKAMLADLQDAAAAAGFEYHVTTHTFRSYGMHSDGGAPYAHSYSTIDHTYTAGVVASVEVFADSSSDHRPLVRVVNAGAVRDPEGLATIQRQNFKRLERLVLEAALLQYDWVAMYQLRDVDVALKYLKAGIVAPPLTRWPPLPSSKSARARVSTWQETLLS
jgi:endonuclease/exonuclease/phosphatase (EEP) superfamily protein YafD